MLSYRFVVFEIDIEGEGCFASGGEVDGWGAVEDGGAGSEGGCEGGRETGNEEVQLESTLVCEATRTTKRRDSEEREREQKTCFARERDLTSS